MILWNVKCAVEHIPALKAGEAARLGFRATCIPPKFLLTLNVGWAIVKMSQAAIPFNSDVSGGQSKVVA